MEIVDLAFLCDAPSKQPISEPHSAMRQFLFGLIEFPIERDLLFGPVERDAQLNPGTVRKQGECPFTHGQIHPRGRSGANCF